MAHLEITYCTGCNWLLRAAWYAQECLSTFGSALRVTLIPDDSGGVFRIALDGAPLWDRKVDGGFPDVRILKQRIRDRIDPERGLGHLDRQPARGSATTGSNPDPASPGDDASAG